MKKNQLKGISKKSYVLLEQGEDKFVEYKENLKGLDSEDIVAFANSENGGTILIGVKEYSDIKNKKQKGKIIGCNISDNEKLKIMNKALACIPPIKIEIFTENTSSNTSFFRIEIPSGIYKPYATNSGTYKIREEARNAPIYPEQLLEMFLEKEGDKFTSKFSEATEKLQEKMSSTFDIINGLGDLITEKIDNISHSLGWAEMEASNANSTIENVYDEVRIMNKQSESVQKRLKSIMETSNINDPIKEETKKNMLNTFIEKLKEDPKVLQDVNNNAELQITYRKTNDIDLTQNEVRDLLKEAASIVEKGNEKSV